MSMDKGITHPNHIRLQASNTRHSQDSSENCIRKHDVSLNDEGIGARMPIVYTTTMHTRAGKLVS